VSQLKNIVVLLLLLAAAYFGLWSPNESDAPGVAESDRLSAQNQIDQASGPNLSIANQNLLMDQICAFLIPCLFSVFQIYR
jgi:hypothetical protein